MPIGVPRIIYCWGEELPAQWTDIYNFIFRRRMVFLMQYLDDELCNQICGLLINIHMEDRSKELEKKEMEKSGLFKKTQTKTKTSDSAPQKPSGKRQSVEDLLTSDQDFGVEDNHMLEQYTLQKISTEWLNWNAQFFDYSEEPYLYYLAEILSKDFSKQSANLKYAEMTKLIQSFKKIQNISKDKTSQSNLDVYSPFRLLANFAPQNFNLEGQLSAPTNIKSNGLPLEHSHQKITKKLLENFSQKKHTQEYQTPEKMYTYSQKALGQRCLKREYLQDASHLSCLPLKDQSSLKAYNYIDSGNRKQTIQSKSGGLGLIQEEESKKVFMIINSFGGSVGNGITVHDALQFIKAGSLTLALGVAASAASLALAGGTIGERYVTEGAHVMLHQPECLTPDHLVLTDQGWLPISEVTLNHKVAVHHPSGTFTYEHPIKVHNYHYKGNMYLIKNKTLDLCVTPNHRMYIQLPKNAEKASTNVDTQFVQKTSVTTTQTHPYILTEAKDILHKPVCYKRTGVWDKKDYQFILPSLDKMPAKAVEMKDWLFFFGSWIANGRLVKNNIYTIKEPNNICFDRRWLSPEGACKPQRGLPASSIEDGKHLLMRAHASTSGRPTQQHQIKIYQINEAGRKRIENCLTKLCYQITSDKNSYYINNKQVWSVLHPLTNNGRITHLPDWVWELSAEQCKYLIDGLVSNDGSVGLKRLRKHFMTSSKQISLDIARLCLHAGYAAKIIEKKPTINSKTNKTLWVVQILFNYPEPWANNTGLLKDNCVDDKLIPYDGPVHCLTVPHGVFFVQRNGHAVWTGNSAINGQASDIWIDSQEIMKIRLDVAEIYSLSTYRPRHKILRDLDRDFYLTAMETIYYGLADEIATNEILSSIIEMTNKAWDYHDSKQQRLLETRDGQTAGVDTQAQL